jgi:hypothetical protein
MPLWTADVLPLCCPAEEGDIRDATGGSRHYSEELCA